MVMMMKSVVLSFLLLLSTVSAQTLRSATPAEEVAPSHQRRELFDFWQILMALGGPPCPPGPLGDACRNKNNNQDAQDAQNVDANANDYTAANGATTQSANAKPDQSGQYVSGKATAATWMLLGAAIAASVAAIAIVFGQRKNTPEAHPLTGSVARRAALFGAFADSALCADGSRTVEMTASTDNKSAMV